MTRRPLRRTLLAAVGAAGVILSAPQAAQAAPSRAELEQSVIELQEALADARTRLRTVEQRLLTGDPAADTLQQRSEAIQSELTRVVGELEEARYMNGRLQTELRTLRREIQLRDAEIAERLGLEPAFTASEEEFFGPAQASNQRLGGASPFGTASNQASGATGGSPFGANPFEAPLGEPSGSTSPAETDPSFFGDDPFAEARAGAVGTLGAPPQLPDSAPDALAYAKGLLMDGRFGDAEVAFADFQERFPGTPEAAEALYWQGETQFAANNFEVARNLYIDALQADPAGVRAADAMVALAASLNAMRLTQDACDVLDAFPTQYPSASLAVRSKADRVRQSSGCS